MADRANRLFARHYYPNSSWEEFYVAEIIVAKPIMIYSSISYVFIEPEHLNLLSQRIIRLFFTQTSKLIQKKSQKIKRHLSTDVKIPQSADLFADKKRKIYRPLLSKRRMSQKICNCIFYSLPIFQFINHSLEKNRNPKLTKLDTHL